jgi:hypothetical protein
VSDLRRVPGSSDRRSAAPSQLPPGSANEHAENGHHPCADNLNASGNAASTHSIASRLPAFAAHREQLTRLAPTPPTCMTVIRRMRLAPTRNAAWLRGSPCVRLPAGNRGGTERLTRQGHLRRAKPDPGSGGSRDSAGALGTGGSHRDASPHGQIERDQLPSVDQGCGDDRRLRLV